MDEERRCIYKDSMRNAIIDEVVPWNDGGLCVKCKHRLVHLLDTEGPCINCQVTILASKFEPEKENEKS